MRNLRSLFIFCILIWALASCGAKQPEPILVNKDNCSFCKMQIADVKFASQIITEKGRVYKFDDLHCTLAFAKDHNEPGNKLNFYFADYNRPAKWLLANDAIFVCGENIQSPMQGQCLVAGSNAEATKLADLYNATMSKWDKIGKY